MLVTLNVTVTVPPGVTVAGLAEAVTRRPFSVLWPLLPKLMAVLDPDSCCPVVGEVALALNVSEEPVPRFADMVKVKVFVTGTLCDKLFKVHVNCVDATLQPVDWKLASNVVPNGTALPITVTVLKVL